MAIRVAHPDEAVRANLFQPAGRGTIEKAHDRYLHVLSAVAAGSTNSVTWSHRYQSEIQSGEGSVPVPAA